MPNAQCPPYGRFVGLFIILVSCSRFGFCQEIEVKQAIVNLSNSSFSTVHASIEVGPIDRGKKTTIPLQFENNLDGEVNFKEVILQCVCTAARIPSDTIKVGEKLVGEIDLSVSKNEKSLQKVFSLEVKATGSVDRILIDVKAKISRVIAFSQELYSIPVDEERLKAGKLLTLRLPVIASVDMSLKELSVSASADLNGKVAEITDVHFIPNSDDDAGKGYRGFVEVKLDPRTIESSSTYLKVELKGEQFGTQVARVEIKKKQPVAIVPETLFFSSTDLENVQAFAIVRTDNGLNAKELRLVSVNLIDGGVVDGVLTASSSKVSRLELTCTKERASQWKQTVKDIEVLLECEGERYSVLIKGRFQW